MYIEDIDKANELIEGLETQVKDIKNIAKQVMVQVDEAKASVLLANLERDQALAGNPEFAALRYFDALRAEASGSGPGSSLADMRMKRITTQFKRTWIKDDFSTIVLKYKAANDAVDLKKQRKAEREARRKA